MYAAGSHPGKFETWESEVEAAAVYEASQYGISEEWSGGGDGYVDWYGLVNGRRMSWIVHEDNEGFFVMVDRGPRVAMARQWEAIVAELEKEEEADEEPPDADYDGEGEEDGGEYGVFGEGDAMGYGHIG